MIKTIIKRAHPLWPQNKRGGTDRSLKKTLRRAATAAVTGVKLPKRTELGILLVGDEEIRRLNGHYRHRDQATNVLSFAIETGAHPAPMAHASRLLGDIVLAYETVAREAHERGIPLSHHLTHLVVHGVLHLLGYDHERSPAAARRQEKREITIMATLGLANPYE